jgi:hypothetical protein
MGRSDRFRIGMSIAAPVFVLLAMLAWLVLWSSAVPFQAAYQLLYIMSGVAGFGCL